MARDSRGVVSWSNDSWESMEPHRFTSVIGSSLAEASAGAMHCFIEDNDGAFHAQLITQPSIQGEDLTRPEGSYRPNPIPFSRESCRFKA